MGRTGRIVAMLLEVVLATVFVLVVGAVPVRAAFPGRDGLLVVQPASGRGLILVEPNGGRQRQICVAPARCDGARDPVWSPDGSEIVFATPRTRQWGWVGDRT